MKNMLIGMLLALSISVSAIEKQQDGSVMLSQQESASIYESFRLMVEAGKKQAAMIETLQRKVDALENGSCT